MPKPRFYLTRVRTALVCGWVLGSLAACGEPPQSDAPDTQPADAELPDLRELNDAAAVGDIPSDIPSDIPIDLRVGDLLDSDDLSDVTDLDVSSDALADTGETWDCALGPLCIGPDILQFCVQGIPQQARCPDDYACPDDGTRCSPQICTDADNTCIDAETAQRCVDYGTRFEEMDCDNPNCLDGGCPGGCWEGSLTCVDEREYDVCLYGELIRGQCPVDELGTTCISNTCMTACERAAFDSDYAGCVFWAVDLDNIVDPLGSGPGAEGLAVVISNVSDNRAEIEIEAGAFGSLVTSAVLDPGGLQTFELLPESLVGTRLHPGAFRITSSVPVLAYQFNPLNRENTSSTDASLLLPESALGERYRVMGYPAQGSNQRGFVTIIGVGTAPTTVSLTPSGDTIAGLDYRDRDIPLDGHRLDALSARQTVARTLQPFDVWQVESSPVSDLTGSLVVSDGPVAVFAGTRCSNIPDGTPNCDHLEHQMLSVASWDRTYVATPGPARGTETTTFRVLAEFDRTFIETTPTVPGTPRTLSAGDVMTFELTEPTTIYSTEPIMVGQYLASGDAGAEGFGDPSFTIIPPVEQFRDSYVFFVPDSYQTDAITLIRRSSAPVEITLDGVDLETAFGDIFILVGDSDFSVAEIEIDDGVHEIVSSHPLGVLVAGFDQDVSYAYPGGLHLYKASDADFDEDSGRCGDGGWLGSQCDTGTPGRCAIGFTLCGPNSICAPRVTASTERCNGIDDDCDGAVDEGDVCVPDFDFSFVSPDPQLIELTEGDTQAFQASFGDDAADTIRTAWFIDDPDSPVATGDTLNWRVLTFEAGVHRVWVEATDTRDSDAYAEREWLVHIHDVATNSPTLYGLLLDRSGQAVVGAPITVQQPGTVAEPVAGSPSITDFRGFFALTLASGLHQPMIVAGSATSVFPTGRRVFDETRLPIREDARADIVLPVARLSGTVYGPADDGTPEPLVNARILIYPLDATTCTYCNVSMYTDADGHYDTLLFTGRHRLTVYPPTGATFPVRQFQLTINDDMTRDIYLDSPPPPVELDELVLTIVESCTGEPVAGARLSILVAGFIMYPTTDENGQVRVELPLGQASVSLFSGVGALPPVGAGRLPLGTVTVPSGDEEVTLEIPNAHVSGTVTVQGEDLGVPNVALNLVGTCTQCYTTVWTSESGEYNAYVLDSEYYVVVTPPSETGWANFRDPPERPYHGLTECDETLDIELSPPVHRLAGTVTGVRPDLEGGVETAPVSFLRLNLLGPTAGTLTTDVDGRFEVPVVPGQYRLQLGYPVLSASSSFWGILPAGRFIIWDSADTLTSTEPDAPVEVLLDPLELPLTVVSGRVTNIEGGGLGLADAVLEWTHQGNSCNTCRETVVTDSDGFFELLLYRPILGADGQWRGDYQVDLDPGEFLPPQRLDVILDDPIETWDIAVEE